MEEDCRVSVHSAVFVFKLDSARDFRRIGYREVFR